MADFLGRLFQTLMTVGRREEARQEPRQTAARATRPQCNDPFAEQLEVTVHNATHTCTAPGHQAKFPRPIHSCDNCLNAADDVLSEEQKKIFKLGAFMTACEDCEKTVKDRGVECECFKKMMSPQCVNCFWDTIDELLEAKIALLGVSQRPRCAECGAEKELTTHRMVIQCILCKGTIS